MSLRDAEHWEWKAAATRKIAASMSTDNARVVMLEVAEHYERLARQARTIAAMLALAEDSPH